MEQEKVSFSAGVPTVWLGLLNHVEKEKLQFSSFKRTVIVSVTSSPYLTPGELQVVSGSTVTAGQQRSRAGVPQRD